MAKGLQPPEYKSGALPLSYPPVVGGIGFEPMTAKLHLKCSGYLRGNQSHVEML